jgi:hypothetical protein
VLPRLEQALRCHEVGTKFLLGGGVKRGVVGVTVPGKQRLATRLEEALRCHEVGLRGVAGGMLLQASAVSVTSVERQANVS